MKVHFFPFLFGFLQRSRQPSHKFPTIKNGQGTTFSVSSTTTIKFRTVELKFCDLLDTLQTARSTFQFLSILCIAGIIILITWIRRVVLCSTIHTAYIWHLPRFFSLCRCESYPNLYTYTYFPFIGVYRVHFQRKFFLNINSAASQCRKYIWNLDKLHILSMQTRLVYFISLTNNRRRRHSS